MIPIKTRIAAVLLLIALLCSGCGSNTYKTISMDEARKQIEAGTDYLLVDVRTQEEYDNGHIPGAILVPIEDIREGKLDALPDKSQKMMLYCWTGRRSEDSAAILVENGYSNVVNIGGFVDWDGEVEGDLRENAS